MADLKSLSPDWPVISARLDEALALTPEARAGWLAGLGDSQAIKDTLRQLLDDPALAETADFAGALPQLTLGPAQFLDAGQVGGAAAEADTLTDTLTDTQPGTLVGPYRLTRQLGVGGMGQVWLAERVDGGLKRLVALKLPRLSWAQGLTDRLRRERDILASLDHPNIARIYDAGVDQLGRPYLALEYVEGEPIDVHCKAQALSIERRLQLILQVARAVAHAHARLVVHRDLKPANILVTAQGQVRLLDFGIAKLMEGELTQETALTRQGGRALTLDYASPEQIRGEPIGTASDVYSLGVVAYELLAQAKPYQLKRQSAAALEEAIASVDVRLASAAAANPQDARLLKGDLDAILNKALKKNVADRYPTVEAFAQDIERHLSHLPVLAQPDAWAYRAAKFWQRNKLAVAAAGAVSASLIAGLSLATWQARVAYAQADRAEQVKAFVLSIFSDADTDSGAGAATTAADLLKLAQARVGRELAGNPEVQIELTTALGYSLIGQGLHAQAARLMQGAVEQATRQLGAQHALTNAARVVQGEALLNLGQNTEAAALLAPSVELATRSGDLRTANAALSHLSSAQLHLGQPDQAIASARQAVANLSEHNRIGKPFGPRDTMDAQGALANALNNSQRPGGVAAARVALAMAREVYGQKIAQPVLDMRTLLAHALVFEGQVQEGLRELDGLVPAAVEMLGPKHRQVSAVASLVGSARAAAGDVTGAIAAHRQSMEIVDALGGEEAPFERGFARLVLAGDHAQARQPERALALLDEAVKLLKIGAGTDKPMTLRAQSLQAGQLAEAGRLVDAEQAFAALAAAPWQQPQLAAHQARLATLRSQQGRHAEALQLAIDARQVLLALPSRQIQARAHAMLGKVQLDAGHAAAAIAPLQQALVMFKPVQVGISTEQAEVMTLLGHAHLALGDVDAALPLVRAAHGFWQAADPDNRLADQTKQLLAQVMAARPGQRSK